MNTEKDVKNFVERLFFSTYTECIPYIAVIKNNTIYLKGEHNFLQNKIIKTREIEVILIGAYWKFGIEDGIISNFGEPKLSPKGRSLLRSMFFTMKDESLVEYSFCVSSYAYNPGFKEFIEKTHMEYKRRARIDIVTSLLEEL